MGRRKERRVAASLASGRRVKLDLFAEPNDTGEEGDGDVSRVEGDGIEETVIPNSKSSSSSSGKRQDNPLLLLGQYSDEEANEEAENLQSQEVPADQNVQVEVDNVKASGNTEDNIVEGVAAKNVKHVELDEEPSPSDAAKDLVDDGVKESASVPPDETQKGDESTALVSDPWTCGTQNAEEVAFGWKLVMHEETNQYYYWNIETGETSWEVPAIFSEGAELGTEPKAFPVIEGETFPLNIDASCNILQTDPNSIRNGSYPCSDGIDGHPLLANEHHETEFALSTKLVNHAEGLIHRLKDLKSSDIQPQGWDWISKYILEIEIRLSDFKSLWAYGSSLLPFWMHSEKKLKTLELEINDHISLFTKSGKTNKVDADMTSFCRDDGSSHLSIGRDPELTNGDAVVDPSSQISCSSPKVDESITEKATEDDAPMINDVVTKENFHEKNEAKLTNREFLRPVPTIEDDDMDVDMEVDDEPTTNDPKSEDASGAKCSPGENFIPSVPPGEWPTTMIEKEHDAPQPANEDWIPPPPPYAEPAPPPPPDAEPTPPPPNDPPTAAYTPQPPYSETLSHLPYTAQYAISYPVSGTEYCGPTMTDIPSSNYFAQSEEPQAVESYSGQYLYTGLSTYSETTPVIVNPLVPSVYHGIPSEVVPPALATSFVGSSGIYGESVSASYHNTTADQKITVEALAESDYSSLSNQIVVPDASATSHETEMLGAEVPPISTSIQPTMADTHIPPSFMAQATTAAASHAFFTTPASAAVTQSTSAVASSASAPKASTKVLRSKKRTNAVAPSMRSNKKVSSLVDKWKAAKEEMHEDEEDEPQNAYEILERKRQKEIEQWKSRQIATGEAKDNANFQPLGGDWRERVKRRRAKKSSVVQRSPPREEGKHTPDSTAAKDLPPGWKAYWDENSKKEYYCNTTTMETTWTRPTQ